MFERPILIYSEYCDHSQKFLSVLMKHRNIMEAFLTLCIDVDVTTRQRPRAFYEIQQTLNYKITEVPTIIVQNGQYVLSGAQAFQWLEFELEQLVKEEELQPFNANEMGAFSDMYSQFGSNGLHDAREQNFKFVNKPDVPIPTPQDSGTVNPEEYSRMQKEREQLDAAHLPKPRAKVRFADEHHTMFSGGAMRTTPPTTANPKQKELDTRLQQLLCERETYTPAVAQHKVDFATGKVLE